MWAGFCGGSVAGSVDWLDMVTTSSATTAATAVLVVLCCLTIALVVVAPLSAAAGGFPAPLVYELFRPVCHQIADRSFSLGGQPLAVCHRCFGFYVGFTAGLIVLPLLAPIRNWLLEEPRRILLFLAPTAIDWLLPFNTEASRFATALLAAAPIAVLVWAAIGQLVGRLPQHQPEET